MGLSIQLAIYLSDHPSKSGPNALMSWSWVELSRDWTQLGALLLTSHTKRKAAKRSNGQTAVVGQVLQNQQEPNAEQHQQQQQQRHTLSMSLLVALHRKQHPAPPAPLASLYPPSHLEFWLSGQQTAVAHCRCAALEMELLLMPAACCLRLVRISVNRFYDPTSDFTMITAPKWQRYRGGYLELHEVHSHLIDME